MADNDGGRQTEVLAFLGNERSYGSGVRTVERIDTHISAAFLAGNVAYKLKRAVTFSYVDFGSLERREAACRAELALNARSAPELYLAVRSITREGDGSLVFEGAGTILDWVVVMRRFDEACLFDHLARCYELDDDLVERTSLEVVRFHAAAAPAPGFGGRSAIASQIASISLNLGLAPADAFPDGIARELEHRWREELGVHGALLDRRAVAGKVRRCHGDLHLRNICLWRGRPTLFDCIEFSDELACIDVLYDLAFLLMDFEYRGLARFANIVFNTYLDVSDESDGVSVLPLLMSLRAAIRAHTGIAAAEALVDPARHEAAIDEARAYLDLAARLIRQEPARAVAIGGLSGSGKSTLAREIASGIGRPPGARLLNTDVLRKRLFGVAKRERLNAIAYEPSASKRVYEFQRKEAEGYLRAGWSAIVDGVFAGASERVAIAESARSRNVPLTAMWLTAPDDVLRGRIARRRNDPSDATIAVLDRQLEADRGDLDWVAVDASGGIGQTVLAARAGLRRAPIRPRETTIDRHTFAPPDATA